MREVKVESLHKSYGDIEALRGLDFAVREGTMYGLIGPDGAGKTTFMRIAVCLLLQTSGTVNIAGFDTIKSPDRIKSSIGYMPQDFSLYGDLTIEENMLFFADLFGLAKKERNARIERLLEFSRLGPFVKRRAAKLSGGMKRKLALSCALIHSPGVLFLDEPTTGVDPVSRREFWDILAEVKRGGTTIIVSTPYMDEAEKCDRVGFIMNGRLITEGTPEDLPGQYPKELLNIKGENIVRLTRKLKFPDIVTDVRVFGDRLHLTVENAEKSIPFINEFLANNNIAGVVVEKTMPSMEDIFVESMGHGK